VYPLHYFATLGLSWLVLLLPNITYIISKIAKINCGEKRYTICFLSLDFRSIEFVPNIFVASDVQPNTFSEVPCRHNLENFLPRKMVNGFFVRKADWKVLSTPVMVGNGAIVMIDGLKTSIILTAPFPGNFLDMLIA
jgi:hypothetical protein